MQNDTTSHLQNVAEAYRARLRALDLQLAQFGPHCPSHIQAELELARSQLNAIEENIALSASRLLDESGLNTVRFPSKAVYVGIVISTVIIVVFSGSFMYSFKRTYAEFNNEDEMRIEAQTDDLVSYGSLDSDPIHSSPNYEALSLICASDALLLEGSFGRLRARSAHLDSISMQQMPIGSRLVFECMSPSLGQVIMIIVRHPLKIEGEIHIVWLVELYRCRR